MKSIVLAVLGLGVAGVAWSDGGERPAVMWMGAHSRVVSPRFERITTKERWEAVWEEHTSAPPPAIIPITGGEDAGRAAEASMGVGTEAPEIDFGRFMVVAYFRGPSRNTRGERVEAIDHAAGALRIRFDSLSYQTATFGGEDRGVAVEPFGLWVVSRTTEPVVIEENVQGLIGGEPVWKERHRFDGLPE